MNRLLEYIKENKTELINEKLIAFISERFDKKIEYVEETNPSIPTVYQNGNEFCFDVKVKISAKKIDAKPDEIFSVYNKQSCFINCKCNIDATGINNFKIVRVDDEPHRNPYDILYQLNYNLLPKDKTFPMQEDADELLKQYYTKEEIESFTNVPVRDLVNRMGLKIEERYRLTPSELTQQGTCCMSDETITLYDADTGEPVKVKLKAGTILIDVRNIKAKKYKQVNFTIAHELYHWLRHRYYVYLRREVTGDVNYHLVCKFGNSFVWKDDDERAEVQANKFAGSLLLSHRDLLIRLQNEVMNSGYYTSGGDKQKLIDKVLNKLSDYYQVSTMTLAIRYEATGHGYPEFEKYTYDFKNKNDHFELTYNEFLELCLNNERIFNLVVNNKLVYYKKHLVINDIKYKKLIDKKDPNYVKGCINVKYEYIVDRSIIFYGLSNNKTKKKVTIDIDKNYDVLTEADVLDFTNNAEELSRLANQNLKVLLKELRNDRGLTQSQLADKLNLDTRQYQKYENQESPLPEDIAFQIITVLKLQPPLSEWLLNESGYTFKNDKKSKALKILMSSSYTKSYDFWTKTLNNIK